VQVDSDFPARRHGAPSVIPGMFGDQAKPIERSNQVSGTQRSSVFNCAVNRYRYSYPFSHKGPVEVHREVKSLSGKTRIILSFELRRVS
jgi:hypothetical protein